VTKLVHDVDATLFVMAQTICLASNTMLSC